MEHRSFSVAPSIIQHLISAQAGSCGKAVAECVMNSIDAGASTIGITLTRTRMIIEDDGCGFATRDAILKTFEVFGFDHTGMERTYGQFGLGRGQMWNFCSTVWRTRTYSMDVDIRVRGLDYVLTEDLPDVPGLRIDGTFYTALTAVEESSLIAEVEELCKYCAVPVSINGRVISRDPAAEKWTTETESAYLRVSNAWGLKVYNQGIFVREVPSYDCGVGGVLSTKRGYSLELNMARNDILRNSRLWKELIAVCKGFAKARIERPRQTRLTDWDRGYIARQMTDPSNVFDGLKKQVFTLSDGRHVSVTSLAKLFPGRPYVTVAEPGSRIAERLMRDRSAIVLSTETLHRFGAETPSQLLERLIATASLALSDVYEANRIARANNELGDAEAEVVDPSKEREVHYKLECWLRRCKDSIRDVPAFREVNAKKVPEETLTPEVKAFMQSMGSVNNLARWVVCDYTNPDASNNWYSGRRAGGGRNLIVGQAECDAYTDGSSYIALTEQTVADAIRKGLAGFLRVAKLLVHEYLHDEDDSGSHQHDLQFYEAYHNVLLDHAEELMDEAVRAFAAFTKQQHRLAKKVARQLDRIEPHLTALDDRRALVAGDEITAALS